MSQCVFCEELNRGENAVMCNNLWSARWDGYPVTPGHVEILPIRHVQFFDDLTEQELNIMMRFVREVINAIKRTNLRSLYESMLVSGNIDDVSYIHNVMEAMTKRPGPPDAFNMGLNDGPIAGQSVAHLHLHIMPRWNGDVEHPKGGVRNLFQSDTYGKVQ